MTALLLLGFAVTFAWPAPLLVSRIRWLPRLPRLGVAVWMCMIAATSAAAVGAGVAATTPLIRDVGGLREFVHRCPQWLAALLGHPLPLALAVSGAVAVVGLVVAAACSLLVAFRQLRVDTRRHVALLTAAGQSGRAVVVVGDDRPAAWSLAGRHGRIVVTSAAMRVLSPEQLTAVVAHERAHLRGRHHLLVTLVRAAYKALPCPLTRSAVVEVQELLEMRADDVAAARAGRDTVATALLRLTTLRPGPALGAGGADTALRRLRRLWEVPQPPRTRGGLAAVVALAALAVPVAMTLAAVRTVISLHFCPLP